ncbi:MAG TPA: DNA internalization-related competence protein ComEC/Rec2 [Burkholderiaceae bacterium]|nr:DNA internalization-related competence protein ComEC/Rec2 [Burkholderiaceae bacterium]
MQKNRLWRERGRPGRWLPAVLGWLAGTALQVQQPDLLPWQVYAALVLAAPVLWALSAIKSAANPLAVGLAGLALAALAFGLCGGRALVFAHDALAPGLEGRDVAVTGVVAAMPQRNESGQRFRFAVEAAQAGGLPVRLPPQIYLGWYSGTRGDGASHQPAQLQPAELHAGERWRLTVRLKAPHGNRNPHGFDYELWLWEQGLQATGYVRAGPRDAAPERLGLTWQHPVEAARQQVRDAIFAHVADRQQAGILAALVTGDQNAIDRADWDIFRATGVAHLMSISGLHVTLFAWLAALVVGVLWRRSERLCLRFPAPSAGLLGGLLLAGAYALFSGWGVPAQRTIWMLATVGLLRLGGRQWPWPQVWLLACAVVLALDPWALLQAGFWLSFVAVGVLFASSGGAAGRVAGAGAGASFVAALREKGREQAVITLALAPLTLLLFQQLSLVGLLANALAIPWVTLVVTPLALLGVAVAPLWDLAAMAVAILAKFLQMLAAWPLATVSVAAPPLGLGVAAIVGGLLLVMRLPWGARLLGLPLLLPVLLWQAPRPASGQFELLAADVGQGNAVLVRTATHALLYDTGPRFSRESDAGHRVLVPLLRALGERVDTVVLSHRDSDHTGGAAAVLAMQPQAALLSSIEAGHELQAVRAARRCEAGQQWTWDGVVFEVLHPQAQDYAATGKPNAISCVLRITNGTRTALLAGDIEQPQEARLVAEGAALRADVLLVPHHGSKTSSSLGFLQAVQPRLALVQAGYRNTFGHPAAPVLERYRALGVEVVDSVHCGAASWSSARAEQVVCEREHARRYWQHRLPEPD